VWHAKTALGVVSLQWRPSHHDGIFDSHLLHRAADVLDLVFEREFGCVHANDDEALLVLLRHARIYGSVRSQLMQV
jgi:hypothetical protein